MPSKTLIKLVLLLLFSCGAIVVFAPRFGGGQKHRDEADEKDAIANLRSIAEAQFRVQESASIDVDGDGVGEFASYGELTGSRPLRSTGQDMQPPQLRFSFSIISPAGVFTRGAYSFRIFLPGPAQEEKFPGLHEGLRSAPDPDAAERMWSIYAWPTKNSGPAKRSFFLNQAGTFLQTPSGYAGSSRIPSFDAALRRKSPGSMSTPQVSTGQASVDGKPWSQVRAKYAPARPF